MAGLKRVGDTLDMLGEGPVWCAREQALYWVDIRAPAVRRLADGKVTTWEMPEAVGSLALREKGGILVALKSGPAVFDPASGSFSKLAAAPGHHDKLRFNDGKCDRQGRLWFGSMHDDADAPVGSLYRWEPHAGCRRVRTGIRTSNGLGWSPDGRLMYYTDSPTRRISVWDYDPTLGVATHGRTFAEDPEGWLPDGLTVDAEGGVWSAKWDGGVVVRYHPDGEVDRVLEMPVRRPTSCMLAGPDLRTLVVTSARHGTDGDGGLAGAVFLFRVEIPGLPESAVGGSP